MSSAFLDPLDLRQVDWKDGRPVWTTLAPLRYRSEALNGLTVVIPADFVTDLASVPRLPIIWLATGGRGPRSAVLHDFPYQFGFWIIHGAVGSRRLYVRKGEVDSVFHESLLADLMSGAGPVRAWEMWAGVRMNANGGIWGERQARRAALNPIWHASGRPEGP